VERISDNGVKISWGRNIISETANWDTVSAHFDILPLAEKSNEEEALEFSVEELGEEIEVGDQGSVEHDGDVGSVEQLDGEVGGVASNVLFLDVKVNSESLYISYYL